LLARVETANRRLLEARRATAQAALETHIVLVKEELQAVKASPDACNRALYPLQQIKQRIAQEESVPRLAYEQGEQASEKFAAALELIEAVRRVNEPAAAPRPVRHIKPASVTAKPYLDNAQDVEEYLARLREQLLDALKDNGRIRLQ
jgi:hypothetical protein